MPLQQEGDPAQGVDRLDRHGSTVCRTRLPHHGTGRRRPPARRHTLPAPGDGGRTRPSEHGGGPGPHGRAPSADEPQAIRVADVVVDEASWTVRAGGQVLDLTYKEFELLRYLVGRPGRVVTRDTLLQEVWGMDYYGGTRTVDVHIRRLRAKLGP